MPPSPLDRYRTDGMAAVSPQRLLVLLYQRLLSDLDRSEQAMQLALPAQAHEALVHAQDIVTELRSALDHDAWEGAGGLDALYRHLEILLIEANVAKSPELVGQCRQVVAPLADAWEQAYRAVTVGRTDDYGRVLG